MPFVMSSFPSPLKEDGIYTTIRSGKKRQLIPGPWISQKGLGDQAIPFHWEAGGKARF